MNKLTCNFIIFERRDEKCEYNENKYIYNIHTLNSLLLEIQYM